MRTLREMGWGVIIAVVSLLLVVGGISLSLAENTSPEQPTPSPLPPIIATSIELPSPTLMIPNTNTPEPPTATIAASPTQLLPTVCPPPVGWLPIVLGANDTLYTIAEKYKTTAEVLNSSNCLNNVLPPSGSLLYVPPVPTVTVVPCGPLAGWIKAYYVQPGDNLFRISLLYRTTVPQLQRANCMGRSTTIFVGQLLWVPNVPTSTPGVTNVPVFNTDTPTANSTPRPTFTASYTPPPSPTTPSYP